MDEVELTPELLIEALEENHGFVLSSIKWLQHEKNCKTSYKVVKNRIENWGMSDWLYDIRSSLAERCMKKVFHKGCAEGDNHCLFWVLHKYGHHVDFLDSADTQTESMKGWKELLDYVKATPESEADIQPKKQ